ncbi:MAG: fibronectin type III domain-containing protein [Elusimicrobia bacterium]|nr:fibronectin type III domain-containing protein [Elusimicrobiota bacterium]
MRPVQMLNRSQTALLVLAASLLGTCVRAADFVSGQNASVVIGEGDYDYHYNNVPSSNRVVAQLTGAAFDASGNLWVSDSYANRVLRFSVGFSSGMNADLVIGQADFVSSAAATTINGLHGPGSIAFDSSGDLWIVDASNSRILEYRPPFSDGMSASLVIGEPDFTSVSTGTSQNSLYLIGTGQEIAFDPGGNLWLADGDNNRVLRFSKPFSNGMNADLVLGQSVFTSTSSDLNCDQGFPYTQSANGLGQPGGLVFDSSGDLWVSDPSGGIREFVPPFTTNMNATTALGAPNLTTCVSLAPTQSSMYSPYGATFDSLGNLWVASEVEQRVLRFSPPFSTGMNASLVLGQSVFTSSNTNNGPSYTPEPINVAISSGRIAVAELTPDNFFGGPRVTLFDIVPDSASDLAGVSASSSSRLGLTWTATGNPYGAFFSGEYAVQYSSDPLYSAYSTTTAQVAISTANVTPQDAQSALVDGLQANTTYFFRLWSANLGQNWSGVSNAATATTLSPPLAAGVPAFLDVALSSVSAQWVALPASPSSATAEGYTVEASSTDFNGQGTVFSSATTDVAQSTLTVSGLSLNTTYYFRAESLNWTGEANSTSLGAMVTLATAPSGASLTVVSSASATLQWSAGGNPPSTAYEMSLSTDVFSTSASTPIAFSTDWTSTSAVLGGLSDATTYYFRVRAENFAGVATGFSAVVSTPTLPGPVTALSTAAPTTTSLMWSWTGTTGAALRDYEVVSSSDGAILGTPPTASFSLTGLSTNTAYGARVAGVDASGSGPLSSDATAYTLAAKPISSTFSAVYVSSLTLAWNADGNPAGTTFQIARSTDGASYSTLASTTSASYTDAGIGNATYYYEIRAFNGDSVASAYDVVVSTYLSGQPPGSPSGLVLTNSSTAVTLTWSASPGPNLLQYDIYWDAGTGSVNYAATFSTVAASTTSFTTGLLTPGTYFFAVRAKNADLLEDQNTNVKAAITVVSADPISDWMQTRVAYPASGKTVWGNAVTLGAALVRGNLAGITQVRFDYRASTTAAWTPVVANNTNNPVLSPPFDLHWNVTGLSAGDYEVRAVARNALGQDDPDPPAANVTVGSVSPDITETLTGSSFQHYENVQNGVAGDIFLAGADGSHTMEVKLPADALGASTSTVIEITDPAPSLPAVPGDLSAAGITVQIVLQNGQTALSDPAQLTATYQDSNGDGLVDGTEARDDRLAFLVYQSADGSWKAENTTTSNLADHSVTVATPHFSVFGVFASAASALDHVRVYPNPFRPDGSDPDQGKPYSVGDPNSGIIFDNLTQGARIRVYDVTGALVWQTTSQVTSGKVQWDARNESGHEVATGGYLAVVTDLATGRSVVKKIAIIRHH